MTAFQHKTVDTPNAAMTGDPARHLPVTRNQLSAKGSFMANRAAGAGPRSWELLPGWGVDGWSVESSALGQRRWVDRVSAAVDDDVVVEPAQGGEVRGVGDTAL